ncbi:MAG TPA: methyltransferase domain-containing protein [Halobacteriales archaeon]|nr:methyltransferase domain-containing protein [Halobacteriales archaeon]
MRRFSSDYLAHTRRGMWEDRRALSGLDLPGRRRVLDVGCGTGELTRVLREESGAAVVGLDADRTLLAEVEPPRVLGDGTRLPFTDDAFDLVVCQALLINLPDPAAAVSGFARVSSDLVAAVEPDNTAVSVDSTVEAESRLARRARAAYIDGLATDVALGASANDLFDSAGLTDVTTTRHVHRRSIDPPYGESAIEGAARKASGERLAKQRETMLVGGLSIAEYDELRSAWREMGRDVIAQMRAGEYEREETVPFYVTVGRV